MTTNVLVIDFGAIVRAGIGAVLADAEEIDVRWFDLTDQDLLPRLAEKIKSDRPDVVVTDSAVDGVHASDVTRTVKEANSATAVVVLSSQVDPIEPVNAIQAGAQGYLVLSGNSGDSLLNAIRQAADGGVFMQADHLRAALNEITMAARKQIGNDRLREDLTARELQVLNLLADGFTNKEIADRLSISIDAVKSNVASLAHKLGSRGRAHTAALATRAGLVDGHLHPTPEISHQTDAC